ncbi:MAG TPA: hypothetical protein VET88_11190 [Gammaproteobacteria bacterium]|nr:hypothetical protein [Gammaproteobacteria bacterium]
MPEYDRAFGVRLADTATLVAEEGLDAIDAQRTVLYLSLLSMEISLKSLLEHAGEPVKVIRSRSHRLADLLADLGRYEVEVETAPGSRQYVSATRLRARVIRHNGCQATVGQVIDAESQGASKYPNNVRYGDVLKHYPAPVVTAAAKEVAGFLEEHWGKIRLQEDAGHFIGSR